MSNMHKKGFSAIVAIIIAVFAIGGAVAVVSYVSNNQSELEQAVGESQAEQAAQMASGYPSLFVAAGLPQYSDATLTKKREGRNLSDGVQVTLETGDNMATIKTFFDAEMAARGFTVPDALPGSDFAAFAVYKNGGKQLSLQITKIGDGPNNKIHLNYHE